MGFFDIFKKKDDITKELEQQKETKELEAIQKAGLHTVDDVRNQILEKTAMPCMMLELTNTKPGLLDSKVSGIGYVPHDGQIPQNHEGKELRLLAQIDCTKITLEDFPHQGLLQFWILNNNIYGLDFEDNTRQDNFRVLYYPDVDKTVTEEEVRAKMHSDTLDDDYYFPVFDCYGLAFTAETDTISACDCRFDSRIAELVEKYYPDEAEDLLDDPTDFEDEVKNGFGHKIGGYPGFTQWDPRSADDSHDVLLFQLDSDYGSEDKIMWGDSGIGNFFINREKLRRCDFSDVLYNWDCC